jgi:hypothetical protein
LGVDAAATAVAKGIDERAYLEVGEQRMAKLGTRIDLIAIAPTLLRPNEIAVADEIGDDLLRRAFADADAVGDFADPDPGVARDAEQHVAVVLRKTQLLRPPIRAI